MAILLISVKIRNSKNNNQFQLLDGAGKNNQSFLIFPLPKTVFSTSEGLPL